MGLPAISAVRQCEIQDRQNQQENSGAQGEQQPPQLRYPFGTGTAGMPRAWARARPVAMPTSPDEVNRTPTLNVRSVSNSAGRTLTFNLNSSILDDVAQSIRRDAAASHTLTRSCFGTA